MTAIIKHRPHISQIRCAYRCSTIIHIPPCDTLQIGTIVEHVGRASECIGIERFEYHTSQTTTVGEHVGHSSDVFYRTLETHSCQFAATIEHIGHIGDFCSFKVKCCLQFATSIEHIFHGRHLFCIQVVDSSYRRQLTATIEHTFQRLHLLRLCALIVIRFSRKGLQCAASTKHALHGFILRHIQTDCDRL